MGCYQISLGDTFGAGTPATVGPMLDAVLGRVPADRLAGHYHDTRGQALVNIGVSLDRGLRVFDSSVGGLGGCPYAPGAKGNVATEAVAAMLAAEGLRYRVGRRAVGPSREFRERIARMTLYPSLQITKDARGVVQVTLNAPDKRNALSGQMIADLTALAADLATDPTVRVVVLAGMGTTFCAGGDLTWMQAQINADRATRMLEATKLAQMLRALNEMPKPLIGRIHGGAYGGGVGLVAICDCALAADSTRFGLTETKLGLIPATISPYVIARMGEGAARQVFMSARIFGAE